MLKKELYFNFYNQEWYCLCILAVTINFGVRRIFSIRSVFFSTLFKGILSSLRRGLDGGWGSVGRGLFQSTLLFWVVHILRRRLACGIASLGKISKLAMKPLKIDIKTFHAHFWISRGKKSWRFYYWTG